MLVDLSKSESEVLDSLRKSEAYTEKNFEESFFSLRSKMGKILAAAKIYILDNYEKISDWSDLMTTLYTVNHENPVYVRTRRKKSKGTKRKSETLTKLLERIEKKTVQPKTLEKVVYDWTDGDISIKMNGKWYNRINRNPESIIDIASYIETKLKGKK